MLESDWSRIEHVLLDLDGTLLDLDFDNHFWQTLVPRVWGAARGLDPEAAQRILQPRFAACAGTLPWYSTEYWSAELGLDIAALKRQDAERIRWLPGAQRFLAAARARGKRLVLLTNAHPQALARQTRAHRRARSFRCQLQLPRSGEPEGGPAFLGSAGPGRTLRSGAEPVRR